MIDPKNQIKKITILIADDHALLRESLGFILNSNPLLNVIAGCSTGEEAVEQARILNPNVVIMDINMDGMGGIEATKQIRKYSPGSKIVGVSQHSHPAYARRMIQAGATGYVTKNSSHEEIINAILEINAGRKYICAEIKNMLSKELLNNEEPKNSVYTLSGRELEVIGEIKKGYSSKEIAAVLSICVRTVEVHRHNILKKLNLKNTASLVNHINSQAEFMMNTNNLGSSTSFSN